MAEIARAMEHRLVPINGNAHASRHLERVLTDRPEAVFLRRPG
jgi:hypothetical protein